MGDLDGLALVCEEPGASEGADDRFRAGWAAAVLDQFSVGDPAPGVLRAVADPDHAQEQQTGEILLAAVQSAERPLC